MLSTPIEEINCTLQRIEYLLREKENNKTTNETRIGALRRISDAVILINKAVEGNEDSRQYFIPVLNEIRETLLGGD